jgi:hypothetical protein
LRCEPPLAPRSARAPAACLPSGRRSAAAPPPAQPLQQPSTCPSTICPPAGVILPGASCAGTDESKLIRLLVSRRNQLGAINNYYIKKYQKTLVSRVCEEFGGDLKAAFFAMLQGL